MFKLYVWNWFHVSCNHDDRSEPANERTWLVFSVDPLLVLYSRLTLKWPRSQNTQKVVAYFLINERKALKKLGIYNWSQPNYWWKQIKSWRPLLKCLLSIEELTTVMVWCVHSWWIMGLGLALSARKKRCWIVLDSRCFFAKLGVQMWQNVLSMDWCVRTPRNLEGPPKNWLEIDGTCDKLGKSHRQ